MTQILHLHQLGVPFPGSFYVDQYDITIGRVEDNDIVISQPYISSRHASICYEDGQYVLKDLDSTNGTAIIHQGKYQELSRNTELSQRIESGAELLFGSAKEPLRFRATIYDTESTDRSAAVIRTEALPTTEKAKGAIGESAVAADLKERLRTLAGLQELDHAGAVLTEALLSFFPSLTDAVFAMKTVSGALKPLSISCNRGTPRALSPLAKAAATMNRALIIGRRKKGATDWKNDIIAYPIRFEQRTLGVLQLGSNAGLDDSRSITAFVSTAVKSLSKVLGDFENTLSENLDQSADDGSILVDLDGSELPLVAASSKIKAAFQRAEAAARSDVWVSVVGPVGSGKTAMARFIHQRSHRAELPLVCIDCAVIDSSAIEARLWGTKDSSPLLARANGGTLFLDNIEFLNCDLQHRILSALENGLFESDGNDLATTLDLRLIVASTLAPSDAVENEAFDRSFAHRLQSYIVELPPLHQRTEDIPLLVKLYAQEHCAALGKPFAAFDSSFVAALTGYDFPGNVRELIGEVQAAVVHGEDGMPLTANDLSTHVASSSTLVAEGTKKRPTLKQQLDRREKEIIVECLERHSQKVAAAAAELGVTRQGLAKKIDRLGIRQ
jgi:DNA-binding NtrC family response regulator